MILTVTMRKNRRKETDLRIRNQEQIRRISDKLIWVMKLRIYILFIEIVLFGLINKL